MGISCRPPPHFWKSEVFSRVLYRLSEFFFIQSFSSERDKYLHHFLINPKYKKLQYFEATQKFSNFKIWKISHESSVPLRKSSIKKSYKTFW